ncbi:uncharacterized protein LOC132295831 [Cornus florida]|uniref:uncharacterized protein LOC132295831 n=1 Tax=Cornus florida TaxID=4283 RepID=UPI00289A797A|nr:uncharacterized protein LOC132295831 [Cornus florida]
MRECISTVPFSVVLNGECGDSFVPFRGLRQGDPLSPFLFLFCTEGLSMLFQEFEARKKIHGLQMAHGCPPISHLLFTDDALLFCKVNNSEVRIIKFILDRYAALKGQLVNFAKSSIFFSPNTVSDLKDQCGQILCIHNVDWQNKYLGLPSFLGKSKVASLNFISDRISSRVKLLKGNLLSKAGREVLLKAVLNALPTNAMQCLKLPKKNCKDITSKLLNFWWSGEEKSNKIKWVSWSNLCAPKFSGGLGFKNVEALNLAVLAKLAWRMEIGDDSLLVKSFKQKYLKTVILLMPHIKLKLNGHGEVNCWKDNWLPDSLLGSVSTRPLYAPFSSVAALINHSSHSWNTELVHHYFNSRDSNLILQIPLSVLGGPDCKVWGASSNGSFSVCSAYQIALSVLLENVGSALTEGCSFEGAKPAQKAHRDFLEFQEIQRQSSLLSLPSPTVVSVPSRWCVPALGCLKLNFDAAFDSSRKLYGGGMILRNHDGHPIRVALVFFSHVSDPSIAEALILRKCLSLLQLWGCQNVVVEGDCQPVTRLQPSAAALCVIF